MPGVETSRFKSQPLNPAFICSICRGVYIEPVQRPSCQHIFCKECITNWLVNYLIASSAYDNLFVLPQVQQTSCPSCRQPLTRNYLVAAPRVLRELIAELEVRCDHHGRGCERFVTMDELDRHSKQCMYNPNYPIKAKFETVLKAKVSCVWRQFTDSVPKFGSH